MIFTGRFKSFIDTGCLADSRVSAKTDQQGKAFVFFRAGSLSGDVIVRASCRKDPSKYDEAVVSVILQ